MKQSLVLLEAILWGYTLIYIFLFGLNAPLWDQLISQTAPAFPLGFFNLMGIFPLLFLLYAWQHYELKTWKTVFLVMGFLLGAYGIILFFLLSSPKNTRHYPPWHITVLTALIIILLGIFYSMAQGDLLTYLQAWTTDAFVGIMVVDFFALYALSVLLSYHQSTKKAWFSWIPMLGFVFFLLRPVATNRDESLS